MVAFPGLETLASDIAPRYDAVILDTSVLSLNRKNKDGSANASCRESYDYFSTLLTYLVCYRQFAVTGTILEEVKQGLPGINDPGYLELKKDAIRTLSKRVFDQKWANTGKFKHFCNQMRPYWMNRYGIGENDFKILASIMFHIREMKYESPRDSSKLAFVSNDNGLLSAMEDLNRGIGNSVLGIYRLSNGQLLQAKHPTVPQSLQDLAVLPAPEKKVELVGVDSRLS